MFLGGPAARVFIAAAQLQKSAVTPTAARYSGALCRGIRAALGARETTAYVAISVFGADAEFARRRLNSSPRVKKRVERTTAVVPRPVAEAGALFLALPKRISRGRETGARKKNLKC